MWALQKRLNRSRYRLKQAHFCLVLDRGIHMGASWRKRSTDRRSAVVWAVAGISLATYRHCNCPACFVHFRLNRRTPFCLTIKIRRRSRDDFISVCQWLYDDDDDATVRSNDAQKLRSSTIARWLIDWLIDWVKVWSPTRNKMGHFGLTLPSQSCRHYREASVWTFLRPSAKNDAVVASRRVDAVRVRRADDVTGDDVTPISPAPREGARFPVDGLGSGRGQRTGRRSLFAAG